ncbi:hypothetical protein E3N88_05907 [Mikania micrantha]|uniref:Uncharacterized protein n=1 Tax=Mikania micrantha TaxID=192012 RepID=A0A5N6PN03_9ASTR|nr:hypothetical protein E3N88_05907 [Mikania micrantha]
MEVMAGGGGGPCGVIGVMMMNDSVVEEIMTNESSGDLADGVVVIVWCSSDCVVVLIGFHGEVLMAFRMAGGHDESW